MRRLRQAIQSGRQRYPPRGTDVGGPLERPQHCLSVHVSNKGEDRWVSKPGSNKVYIHNRRRSNLFTAQDAAASCPVPVEDLLPARTTSVVYLDAESEVIEDDWHGEKAVRRKLSHELFGFTIFTVRPGTVVNATPAKPKVGNYRTRKHNARKGETPVLYEYACSPQSTMGKVSELYTQLSWLLVKAVLQN